MNDTASSIDRLQHEVIDLRKENERLRRLASFPELNPIPTFEFNRQGQLIYLNHAAEQTLAELDLSDEKAFLPDDFEKIYNSAKEKIVMQSFKEIKVKDHIFDKTVIYSQEYDTIRIYAADITQRHHAEEALKRSREELSQTQEFLEAATKGTGVIIATVDKDMNYTYFNQAYQEEVRRLSGKDIQVGMSLLASFTHLPEQQKLALQEWSQVLQGETTNKILPFGDAGIYQRVYNVLHTPIRASDGTIVGAGEVAYDLTDQVRTQEALLESEARFRMMFKNAPITVAAQDKDLRFIWAYNQRTVDPADVIGKTDADIFPPDVAAWLVGLKRQVLETGKELHEQGWVMVGEKSLFLDLFFEPIRDKEGQIIGVGVATVDLTRIKNTEQALQESEERYRSLFERMTEGFSIHELIFDEHGEPCDYRFLDINPAFERLTGLMRQNVIGKTYHEVLPAEGDRWVDVYARVVLMGEPVQFEEYSPTLNRYYEVFAYRYAPNQFATIFLDITKRKQAEDDLQVNLTKYRVLFETLPLGVTVSDKDGHILESNREATRLLGLPEEAQKHRSIQGKEWKILRPDKTPMPPEEFASVRAIQEQRRIENVEMGIVKDDNHISWISVTAVPLPLEDYGVVIAYNDITRRMLAEEELHQAHDRLELTVQQRTQELIKANEELRLENEQRKRIESQLVVQTKAVEAQRQRFNDVLEILPAYLILLTPDYRVAFANRYFRQRFGEDHGRRCYEYLFYRSEPCENCETFKVLQTGDKHQWYWTGPDSRNYDVYDFPFTDVDGSKLILEMGIDITARKQAEEKLHSLNAYNRSLIEANLDALVTITPDGSIGDVNAVTEAITGYTRRELIGTAFHAYFTDPDKARAGYEQVFETGMVRDYELEIQHRDGHITPVIYNASVYHDESGKVSGVFAAARDITERKEAEQQLILITTALEAAANGIILVDKDGTIIWCNPAFSRMTGYAIDEVVGKNPRILKSGRQDQAFYKYLWGTIQAGRVWRGEIVNRRKDGSFYYEEQIITPVFDRNGEITNYISIRQDITEHKQAEAALMKSEEQYRSLVSATSQIVWQTTADGQVVEDIPTWRAFTGQSVEELLGQGWISALHPDDQQRVAKVWATAVEAGSSYDTEYRIQSISGEYSDFSVRGVPIKDKDGNILSWVGTCTDITDKKRIENQLIQAEKHAVIGRMVGSVTHEINNPLQTIKNCLYLIQQDTDQASPSAEPLQMALSETQRLSNLVGQLRQLYRSQAMQPMRSQELLALLEEVHALIKPELNNSRVSWREAPGLQKCFVNCVKDQIIEVFLNISLNAIEAMRASTGVLSIDMVFPDDSDQVGIIFTDNGPGIASEILPHIFEPFITTKEYGLGLGLSICYEIIQKHGGQITVDSQPEQGTSFTVWLPILNDAGE